MGYNINNNNLYQLLLSIKADLDNNADTIKKLLSIDYKYCKTKIYIEQLKNILNRLENEEIDTHNEQKVIISYNGSPYTTLNLSILAIITNTAIILDYNQKMIGLNTFLIQTINDALKSFNTNKLIYIKDGKENKEEQVDKIICIDDINKYNAYVRKGSKKARFYSMDYLDFYCDSDEFEDIAELIFKYAEQNNIPIESYSELECEEAVNMLKNGLGRNIVILTNNEKLKETIKDQITDKKIYINQNPFTQEIKLIDKEIFYI